MLSSSTTSSAFLLTSSASPVSISSLTFRFTFSITRPSAGIISPVAMWTISPGTMSDFKIVVTFPSLITFTWISSVILESALAAFFDLPSVTIPIPTPNATATTIPIASGISPTKALTAAAINKIIIIGSVKPSLILSHNVSSSPGVNSFLPYFSCLVRASPLARPCCESTLSSSNTFSEGSLKYFIYLSSLLCFYLLFYSFIMYSYKGIMKMARLIHF